MSRFSRPFIGKARFARRRPLIAVAALAAMCGVLVGCGGGSGDGEGGSSVVVLTNDQIEKALLTLDNMPDGWTTSSEDHDDDEDAPGCLANLDDVDSAADSEADAEAEFEVDDDFGLPALANSVASFKTDREVSDAMDAMRDAFSDCNHLEYTDPDDGTEIVLDFSTDDEKSTSDVDDQFNLEATGSISAGLEFPFGLWLSVVRVDNHTTLVMISDLSDEGGSLLDPYVQIAVDRLVAVIDGEEPVATQGPGAAGAGDADADTGSDSEDADGDDDTFEELPIDGGSYTWDSSGVTMKLVVDRVEPYGQKDDFCGDGSCGVANPDDTRVVLRYEVTVPDTAAEPFDPIMCPGLMYPTSGSEDDALHQAYGPYSKSLSGKIFPGSSKTGVVEYAVEKAYADQEFYIESSCGDTDYRGETAYFVGTFDAG